MSFTEYDIVSILAKASEEVYKNQGNIDGYNLYSVINDSDTGFNLQVFKKENSNEYIFSFRGTELSAQDAYTDLNLGIL